MRTRVCVRAYVCIRVCACMCLHACVCACVYDCLDVFQTISLQISGFALIEEIRSELSYCSFSHSESLANALCRFNQSNNGSTVVSI